jgi:DNA invertase Pin-like site-specific DNA recombinase
MADTLCLYIRPHPTSTAAQQLDALTSWAEGSGHLITATFTEPERKRGLDYRREATRMLAEAPNGRWDRLAAASLLALCRSVQHADSILAQLGALGIAVTTLAEGIDTSRDDGRTAAGFALAGQLDHDLHAERAFTGVRKRAAAGFPVGRPRVPSTTEARIIALVRAGTSTERITRLVGCGKSTVYRVRDELKAAAEVAS